MLSSAIDSGLATGLGSLILAVGTVVGIVLQQRRTSRKDRQKLQEEIADAPSKELNATSQAAEAIARAAASLIAPFQQTIAGQSHELGELREAVRISRAAEEKCQRDLVDVKAKLTFMSIQLDSCRTKLREVTDNLGLEPNNG